MMSQGKQSYTNILAGCKKFVKSEWLIAPLNIWLMRNKAFIFHFQIPMFDQHVIIILSQRNAEAAKCAPELCLQLKDAAKLALGQMKTNVHGDVPVLISGPRHVVLVMSQTYWLAILCWIIMAIHIQR